MDIVDWNKDTGCGKDTTCGLKDTEASGF